VYKDKTKAGRTTRLSIRKDYRDKYKRWQVAPGWNNGSTATAKVEDRNGLVPVWFFYFYKEFSGRRIGMHEGDWRWAAADEGPPLSAGDSRDIACSAARDAGRSRGDDVE